MAPRALIEALVHQCDAHEPTRTALLVVSLNRSDRVRALAQDETNPQVLAEVARRVQSMMRPVDRCAFVANDELWLMLGRLADESLASLAGRTLRESLLRPIRVRRGNGVEAFVQLHPVIGGAWTAGRSLLDPLAMVDAASECCARARTNADRVLVARLDDDAAFTRRDELERELRAALHANELDVHFQPQIELAGRGCVAVEALIRWTRSDGSMVSPALIASVCEERGLMRPLTQYVLNEALRQQKGWSGQGIDVSVSINLSAATLADAAFPSMVAHALATWGVPGHRLTLELTEAALVRNEHAAIDFMAQLRALGCQLALDDFGTGYSSFDWLRRFPLDELKLDRAFVRELDSGNGDARTIRALVDLAHAFGLRALAEGVESESALRALAAAGCDRAQGWRFSPALPGSAFVDWCRRHREAALFNGSAEAAIP